METVQPLFEAAGVAMAAAGVAVIVLGAGLATLIALDQRDAERLPVVAHGKRHAMRADRFTRRALNAFDGSTGTRRMTKTPAAKSCGQ